MKELHRRDFLKLAGTTAASLAYPFSSSATLATSRAYSPSENLGILHPSQAPNPDYHFNIAMNNIEIAQGINVETLAINGITPGPLVRLKEGKVATIQVSNHTKRDELMHWHGLYLPADVDGAKQQGSPMIEPGKALSYRFIPKPSGTRWYHSHSGSGGDFRQGTYSGMHGIIYIEPKNEPGNYDREIFMSIHEWGTRIVGNETVHSLGTINGRMLGHGEPIRVKKGERVMFRILNSSPSVGKRMSLSGHKCTVIAADGHAVPTPVTLERFNLGPAERLDVIVEMNNPGKWIFGEYEQSSRDKGLGIIVEYAHAKGPARWVAPPDSHWLPLEFTDGKQIYQPDKVINMAFEEIPQPEGTLSKWTVNGRSFPDMDNFMIEKGKRYRLNYHNKTTGLHPLHLHRHTFEVTHYMGQQTSGLFKDTLVVPPKQKASVDFIADDPGLTLWHCHMTSHMENGFMALFEYKT